MCCFLGLLQLPVGALLLHAFRFLLLEEEDMRTV